MKSPELHLFIIWEEARSEEKAILSDIRQHFDIIKTYEVFWTKKNFSSNLTRFYDTNLPPGSGKEEHIGTGPFLLVIVRDKDPDYKIHPTSKGKATVNSNTFLAKMRHRELTGGGHRVHATNSTKETEHDLALLLGLNIKDFLKQIKSQPKAQREKPDKYKNDLIGANGWQSVKQLFYILNSTTDYMVMRNFEPLPDKYYADQHGDIDLITSNYQQIQYIANARPVFAEPYRVHNKVLINNEWVLFDFRFLGDNYYDEQWEKDLLRQRVLHKGVYVADAENYFFSLLYHSLIHKPQVAEDYIKRLEELKSDTSLEVNENFFTSGQAHKVLGQYLARHNYVMSVPHDSSVYVNQPNFRMVKQTIWRRRPIKYGVRKIKSYRKN